MERERERVVENGYVIGEKELRGLFIEIVNGDSMHYAWKRWELWRDMWPCV